MRARASLAVAVSLVMLLTACSGGDDPKPTPEPTPTPAESSTPSEPTRPPESPTAAPTPVIRTFETRPAIAPPAKSQLFIVTGCTECDGPDETLQLHQTSAAGVTAVTTIMGPGHEALEGMTIGQIDAAVDGTLLAVTACADEYCGGMGNREQPIDWRVLVSVNDGADWTVAYESNVQYAFLEDVTVEGLIVGEIRPDGSVPSPRKLTAVNLTGQQRELTPPTAAGALPRAVLLARGEIGWLEYGGPQGGVPPRALRADGTPITLRLPAAGINDFASLVDGTLVVTQVSGRSFVSTHTPAGEPKAVFELEGLRWNGMDPSEGVFGLANSPAFVSQPVLIDFFARSATPLTTEFLASQQGRNSFIAYDFE